MSVYDSRHSNGQPNRRIAPALLALVAVVVLGAVAVVLGVVMVRGGSDQSTRPAAAWSLPPSLGRCDKLAGLPTAKVVSVGLCDRPDGGQQIMVTASYDCRDGRSLHWSDTGWGWSDGKWQAHARKDGQLVPPDSEMAKCTG